MPSAPFNHSTTRPELGSLYQISLLPSTIPLKDFFYQTMTILSQFFQVRYAALFLREAMEGDLQVAGLYGIAMEDHPLQGPDKRGVIGEVFLSRLPMIIHSFDQEPFYEWVSKGPPPHRIVPPLLCVPLLADNEAIGVITANPLYGHEGDFEDDLRFLSILSALLSPTVKQHLLKREVSGSMRRDGEPLHLEEILEERLNEFLKRVDPYVESKSGTGLLHDVVSLVEKILIKLALEKMNHVQTSAALLLGINRNTLRAKLKELKIKSR